MSARTETHEVAGRPADWLAGRGAVATQAAWQPSPSEQTRGVVPPHRRAGVRPLALKDPFNAIINNSHTKHTYTHTGRENEFGERDAETVELLLFSEVCSCGLRTSEARRLFIGPLLLVTWPLVQQSGVVLSERQTSRMMLLLTPIVERAFDGCSVCFALNSRSNA